MTPSQIEELARAMSDAGLLEDGYAEGAALAIAPIITRWLGEARMAEWQPIKTAPFNKVVRVKVGGMTMLARLVPDASMDDEERECDQWQAENEGEHPSCWSGGCCWSSNEDEIASLQPTHWMPETDNG